MLARLQILGFAALVGACSSTQSVPPNYAPARAAISTADASGAEGDPRAALHLKLARDQVMAVGDNLNDVEMLDFAGTAFLMGNATDALKARGYRLTGTNNEHGLASAIRSCLRIPSRRP